MMRGIGEALHDILETAAKACRPPKELRDRDYVKSTAALNFIRQNLEMNPPLYFIPSNFLKLEKLARTVMPDGIMPGTFSSPTAESPVITSVPEITSLPIVDSKIQVEEAKRERKEKKRSKVEEMNAAVSSLETDAKAPAKGGKKERKKKRGESSTAEDLLASAAPPDTDTTPIGPDATIIPSVLAARDMFCKPCSETYISPEPAPPPPPPPAAWAGSVSSILQAIKACPDKNRQRALKLEAKALMEIASIPPHRTSLLLTTMYKTLAQVSGDFENVMLTATEESGRPVVELLLKTYYDQVEAEEAVAEAAERLKDAQGSGEMDWPFGNDENDTDAIFREEERKDAKREQAQIMLHYIMRWVHVLTEAKCILKYGVEDFQEQIKKEQATVAVLIEEKFYELSLLGMNDDSCWKTFDLQRRKQVLDEEFAEHSKRLATKLS